MEGNFERKETLLAEWNHTADVMDIYAISKSRARSLCYWKSSSRTADLDDIVQDTVIRLWETQDRYDASLSAGDRKGWVSQTTFFVARNFHQKNYIRRKDSERLMWVNHNGDEFERSDYSQKFSPYDCGNGMDSRDEKKCIKNALQSLGEGGEMLWLMYSEGYSRNVLAERFNISETNVGAIMSRARKKLARNPSIRRLLHEYRIAC